jgi:soluble lytic murein transglycosylase
VTHFSYLFRRYGSVVRALASYNAGETVVNRWVKKNGLSPELWVEAVDYTETRNYIKKIFLTRYFYDRIYGYPRPTADSR